MTYRDFGASWVGWAVAAFIAYAVTVLAPGNQIALMGLAFCIVVSFVLGLWWFLESALMLSAKYADLKNQYDKQRAILSDPDILLADVVSRMRTEALQVFSALVEIDLDPEGNQPLPGFEHLTRSYAMKFMAMAMNQYPDLPAVRWARGTFNPREQAAELTGWLVRQGWARAGAGSRPARWVSIDAKLEAARKFGAL